MKWCYVEQEYTEGACQHPACAELRSAQANYNNVFPCGQPYGNTLRDRCWATAQLDAARQMFVEFILG